MLEKSNMHELPLPGKILFVATNNVHKWKHSKCEMKDNRNVNQKRDKGDIRSKIERKIHREQQKTE